MKKQHSTAISSNPLSGREPYRADGRKPPTQASLKPDSEVIKQITEMHRQVAKEKPVQNNRSISPNTAAKIDRAGSTPLNYPRGVNPDAQTRRRGN